MATAAREGLLSVAQTDFSAGGFQAPARTAIPENGSYMPLNLLTDAEGDLFKRGGSEYVSNAAFGTKLNFLWDGFLVPGARTLFASPTAFGTLDGDGITPINLGNSGLAAPTRAVELNGLLVIGGNKAYGGSRKLADYSTSTATFATGSKQVDSSGGTSWLADVDPGMIFLSTGLAGINVVAVVESVVSNTRLMLRDASPDTGIAVGYSLSRFGYIPGHTSQTYAVAARRLISVEGNRVWFSDRNLPFVFGATSYHELSQGAQGIGAAGIRDRALIFTTSGLWTISNMAYDLTDAAGNVQHRLEHAQPDLILWSNEGIVPWQNGVLVPAVDGLWFVDGISAPISFSDNIRERWVSHVTAGYKTGLAAVYRNHYLVPILDSSGVWQDTLACRLPKRAWSRLSGHAAYVSAFAGRVGSAMRQPSLLGASIALTAPARVTRVSTMFDPTAARKADAEGTAPGWSLVTRDYRPSLGASTFRKVRVTYELVDAGSDNPTFQLAYSTGAGFTAVTTPQTNAPEDDGRVPVVWTFNAKGRVLRLQLSSNAPAASFVLKSIEVFYRPSGRP